MFIRPQISATASVDLLEGLVSWWDMESNMNDSHDVYNFGGFNGTPTHATGHVGNAMSITPNVYAVNNTSAFQGPVNGSFSIALWVNSAEAVPAGEALVNYGPGNSTNSDLYNYMLFKGGNSLQWLIRDTGSWQGCFRAVPESEWAFVACGYNADTDESFLSVNDGTPDTASIAGTLSNNAQLMLGHHLQTVYATASYDSVAWYQSAFTPAHITALYNNGNGVDYSDL